MCGESKMIEGKFLPQRLSGSTTERITSLRSAPPPINFTYTSISLQRYDKQLTTWKQLHHPNVVPILGAGPDIAELCIVCPWMPDNLPQHLREHHDANRVTIVRIYVFHIGDYTEFRGQDDWSCRWSFLSPSQRCHSRSLDGGQSRRSGRFHLLTAMRQENILFDNVGVPRITNFGISSITLAPCSSDTSTPFHSYSLRWAAPEMIEAPDEESRRPTKMSDVYAFGMVAIEVRCRHPVHQPPL